MPPKSQSTAEMLTDIHSRGGCQYGHTASLCLTKTTLKTNVKKHII